MRGFLTKYVPDRLCISSPSPSCISSGAELEILVWGGPRLNYLVVSHNSRKTQNAMYMFLCIGLINVILIST